MRIPLLICSVAAALFLPGTAAHAAATPSVVPPPIYALTEEDDGIFTHQDRHYTQGLLLSRTTTPQARGFWDQLADHSIDPLAHWLGAGPANERRDQWLVGQSIFTPTDTKTPTPDPHDRPYAGWLYTGAGLMQRSASGRIDHLQLLVGVVGPAALAQQTQDTFHALAGFGKAEGYGHQLRDEPGLILSYQTIWDRPVFSLPWFGARPLQGDVLPELGVTLGNVLTYGEAGLTLRLGQSLAAGGTPRTITPGLSGSGWFDPARINGAFSWMIYGGIQTRAVWRNLFLEGNSYLSSPGVRKRNFVTDEDVGMSFLFRFGLRVDITYIKRSREFVGQINDDRVGSITLSTPF